MPELLHPGVYVLEVPSGARPIEGVSTSTAAFIGVADKGPIPGTTLPNHRLARPLMVTSFTDYSRNFGGFRIDSFLTYAARSFFDNGGHRLYVVRVAGAGAAAATFGAQPSAVIIAATTGAWSGQLGIVVDTATNGDPTNFDLLVLGMGQTGSVVLERTPNLTVANATATLNTSKFVRLGALPQVGGFAVRPANSFSLIATTAGVDDAGAAFATVTTPGANGIVVTAKTRGTWANAADANLTVSIVPATNGVATNFDIVLKLKDQTVERFTNVTFGAAAPPDPSNYAGSVVSAAVTGSRYITLLTHFTARPADTGDVSLAGGTDVAGGVAAVWGPGSILAASAANAGVWGNAVGFAITNSSDRGPDNFKVLVTYNGPVGLEIVETYDNVTYKGSPSSSSLPNVTNPAEYAQTVVNARSAYLAFTSDILARPPNSLLDSAGRPIPTRMAAGNNGADVIADGFQGSEATSNAVTGTGLHALDKLTDVNLIAIPGQGDPSTVSAGVDYCKVKRRLSDCFFIGDMGTLSVPAARLDGAAPNVSLFPDVRDFATTGFGGTPLNKSAGDFGAIYYPWVWAADPVLGQGQNPRILLPPSGFLAGLYSRIDNSRGVFKAPAGTEAGVVGALSPATTVSDVEQDQFNPISVNIIRTVPGSGIVVWGTRTFGSDPAWRYIPVRRMAIFLRVSIYYGIQWAVFEPNDEPLWSSLRTNIRSFMLTQFRAGAFQGSTPDAAFFVKCDSDTTTQQDIDLGIVNILVGFAPLKPAEFVVLRLSQKVNQPAT